MKKLLSATLAVIMMLSMLALPVVATESTEPVIGYSADLVDPVVLTNITNIEGVTTLSESAYKIDSVEGMNNFAELTKKNNFEGITVYLDDDIIYGDSDECKPIATVSSCFFQGTFDGQGHTISNFKYTAASGRLGLLFFAAGATIQNLKLDSTCCFTMTGASADGVSSVVGMVSTVGGVVRPTTVKNISSAATVIAATSQKVAGIVGYKAGAQGLNVENCEYISTATVNVKQSSGGILGFSEHEGAISIQNCKNTTSFAATNTDVAGMIGLSNAPISVIENCVNTGTMTSTHQSAGIIGKYAYNAAFTISNCINEGTIGTAATSEFCGGILGQNSSTAAITIINCTNNGVVQGKNYLGGIAGWFAKSGSSINGCSNYGAITASNAFVGGILGGSGAVATVNNCANYKKVTLNHATNTSIGDITGREDASYVTVTNSPARAWTRAIQKGEAYNKQGDTEHVYQDIRVIGIIDSLNYEKVGFEIVAKDKNGETVQTINLDCNYVYESLVAVTDGVEDTITANDDRKGGYYFAVVIQGVPAAYEQLTFEIKTYTIANEASEKLYGASGTVTVELDQEVKKN